MKNPLYAPDAVPRDRAGHEADDKLSLERAALALRESNPRLKGVAMEKLQSMASNCITEWILARCSIRQEAAPGLVTLRQTNETKIREVPNREIYEEPHIEAQMGNLADMDFPWHLKFAEWPKVEAVRMFSTMASLTKASKMAAPKDHPVQSHQPEGNIELDDEIPF